MFPYLFLLKVGEKNPENWQPQQFQVPTQLDSRIRGFFGVKFQKNRSPDPATIPPLKLTVRP